MVLHQPSAITFNLIDKLYIMSRTGSIIYNGLTKDLIEFLDQIHIDLPAFTNAADLLIEIASGTHQKLLNKLTNCFSIPIEQYVENIQNLQQLRYAHGEFRPAKQVELTSATKQIVERTPDTFDEIEQLDEFANKIQTDGRLTSWTLVEQANKKRHFKVFGSFYNLTRRYIYLIFKDRSLGRNRLLASILLGLFVGHMYGEIGTIDGCSITHDYIQQKLIETATVDLNNITLKGKAI